MAGKHWNSLKVSNPFWIWFIWFVVWPVKLEVHLLEEGRIPYILTYPWVLQLRFYRSMNNFTSNDKLISKMILLMFATTSIHITSPMNKSQNTTNLFGDTCPKWLTHTANNYCQQCFLTNVYLQQFVTKPNIWCQQICFFYIRHVWYKTLTTKIVCMYGEC